MAPFKPFFKKLELFFILNCTLTCLLYKKLKNSTLFVFSLELVPNYINLSRKLPRKLLQYELANIVHSKKKMCSA